MEADYNKLLDFTNAIVPFTELEKHAFVKLWTPLETSRKEILTSEGEQERFLYFVLGGVQRVYYFDDQNREATLVFTYPLSFGGVLDAMLMSRPSRYYYETLTPSRFLRASFEEVKTLSETSPSVQQLLQTGTTAALSGLLERMVELQCFSSEEKFRNLLKRSPHILQLVPHKYLANYLGIDPTNFSKLINRIKI